MVFFNCLPLLPGNKDDYLRKAAEKGDVGTVNRWIEAGVPADPLRAHHTSALQLAAKGGHLGCVKALIGAGADVNRVADGSPLLDAAAYGHVEVVNCLLDRKANLTTTWNGNTIIHVAARSGHQAIVDMVAPQLDMTAMATTRNGEGKTPLMLACSQSQNADACVGCLLSAGADPAADDLAGNTALHHAAIAANQAAAKLLLASGPRGIQALNMVNNKGRTPLHLAAVFGHHALVQMLAKQDKADVNIKDKEGSTVLHMVCKSVMCAMSGQHTMAMAVLDSGADPEAMDNAGNTPAQYSSYASVKALLQSATEAKVEPKPSSTQAVVPALQVVMPPELPTSSSGAASQPAPNKAEKLAGALTDAMAALGAEGGVVEESNWVMKQALRRNTSDEADGWKLTTAADAGATLDDSPVISLTGAH